ncbi:MAG: ATP-grasp domain-containing protein [Methylovulum sp.]|nr:ATP-grasp domain-containing protein [Methylovulum sp.]
MNAPQISPYILIIASSARMLAQAASIAGLKPLVIDLFADLDTQRYAEACQQVSSLAIAQLAVAIDFFVKRYAVVHVIYGSGFEYYPESLYYLDSRLTLLGNTPDTFVRLQDKVDFFSALSALDIPYPEVAFTAPGRADNWLVKPVQGQGGVGIKRYHHDCPEVPVYWQQYQPGSPQSVLFLADGQAAQTIGFNTQWTVGNSVDEAFIFSGIINSSRLTNGQRALISGWLAVLVTVFDLKGLNSLDFIQDGKGIYVLEINPRLSASMQLYADGLLARHIRASLGDISGSYAAQNGYVGYQIIYAERDITIPEAFAWPRYGMDLPAAGVICRKERPICSIIARHNTPRHVFRLLQRKQHSLLKQLHTF